MLDNYRQIVADLVRDDADKITVAEQDRAIGLAVLKYSKDRERLKVEDVTPTDAHTIPLPASWQADFSALRSLEHPIGRNPPSFIAPARYGLYQSPAGLAIKPIDSVTVAAGSVRATYNIAHVVDAAVDTIPVADREPVSCWAAALLCEQLASLYAGNTDSTIQAQVVQSQSKSAEYAKRAASLRRRYETELGLDEKRSESAGVVVQIPSEDSRGRERLTHGPAYLNQSRWP